MSLTSPTWGVAHFCPPRIWFGPSKATKTAALKCWDASIIRKSVAAILWFFNQLLFTSLGRHQDGA